MNLKLMEKCELCPRKCMVNRYKEVGFCGAAHVIKIARAALHFMEEPCISGKNGSGTVFFSGCNMKCCYCQNFTLSHENYGKDISENRLSEIFLELQEKGANNINLVTGVMYIPMIIKALDNVKHKLDIPVVYNCGGYECSETLKLLEGYVDIYLQDIKYFDDKLAIKYSNAPKYFENAISATEEMIRQTGSPLFYKREGESEKLLKKGVIIRHLVLPGGRKDSINILEEISKRFDKDSYLISLMSQYTPVYNAKKFKEINRRITSFEYNSVVEKAIELGIDMGYMQSRESVGSEYTPDFDLEGV